MENEYYTPSIEEFHVGFEYEILATDKPIIMWEKEIFAITTHDDLKIIDDEIRESLIRVKCLNKEDIEEVGFEYVGGCMDGRTNQLFNKELNGKIFQIECSFKAICQVQIKIFVPYGEDVIIVKSISIRNKPELERLLKQLDIL